MTYEQMKKRIQEQRQLDMIQSILDDMEIAINNDENYSEREYTLSLLFDELKEYFGEA